MLALGRHIARRHQSESDSDSDSDEQQQQALASRAGTGELASKHQASATQSLRSLHLIIVHAIVNRVTRAANLIATRRGPVAPAIITAASLARPAIAQGPREPTGWQVTTSAQRPLLNSTLAAAQLKPEPELKLELELVPAPQLAPAEPPHRAQPTVSILATSMISAPLPVPRQSSFISIYSLAPIVGGLVLVTARAPPSPAQSHLALPVRRLGVSMSRGGARTMEGQR